MNNYTVSIKSLVLLIALALIFVLLTSTVSATAGMIAYGEGVAAAPKYRIWNGTGWESEYSASEVGGVTNMVVLRSARTRDEKILGVLDKSGHINVQVWNGSAWGSVLEVTTVVADYNCRGFDIAYEDSSGDALIVYQNNTDDPLYRVWNGTGWSDAATLDLPTAGIPVWIRMASKPGADEIIVMTLDKGSNVTAAVWDGSAWDNSTSLEGAAESSTENGIAIAYESTNDDAMVAWSDGAEKSGGPQYRFWNGSAWGAEATAPETGGESLFIELGSDPLSDKIVMGAMDSGNDVNVNVWDGTAWGTNEEVTTGAEFSGLKPADVGFESTSGEALAAYSENGIHILRYRTWSAGTWSDELLGPDFGNDLQTGDIKTDPNSDDIMLAVVTEEDPNYLRTAKWNGSAWGTVDILETGVSSTFASFMLSYDRHFIISDVEAGGLYYSVGDTISVTWNLTGSASATEDYINVEYWDMTAGTQFDLKSYATSATSSTSEALTDSEVGHEIDMYVYTTSSSTGNNSTAITQGNPWPYSSANAVRSWESYNDAAHNTQDNIFTGDEHTVYMHGTGFLATHEYRVAYYEADTDGEEEVDAADHVMTDNAANSDADGNLSSDCVFTSYPTSDPGTWHAIVCERAADPPSTYDSGWANITADDSFTVEENAIPEFSTVIAAIAVCMLCAVAYVVMRRNKYGKK